MAPASRAVVPRGEPPPARAVPSAGSPSVATSTLSNGDDSSYFEGDFSSAYEDIHGERIDLEYLIFLQRKGLPYYGKGGAPHDSRPHWAAFESSCEPFHGPRD